MKFLIFPLLFVSANALACAKKIDESKVMLFVDTNFSDLEIETAKKAACQRGEKLMVIPRNFKEYTAPIKNVEAALNKLKGCKQNCEKLAEDYQKAFEQVLSKRPTDFTFKKELEKELAEIKRNNARVSNFILSGHDGGGTFSGHKGSIDRSEIADVLSKYKDINDTSTLMLLGCYTGVQNEIIHWKGIFPKVRMIGGYDGSAPLSDKPMGHHYLEDLLVKEKSLLQQADEKQINNFVKANIRGLASMNSAVYLEPVCSEDSQEDTAMYYGSLTNKRFSKFDLSQCAKSAAVLNDLTLKFNRFDSGEVEPPKNPSDPAIKTVYDQARNLEHCVAELELPLDVNALFNLRFYDAVKTNFSTFYQNEINSVAGILKDEEKDWEMLEKEIDEELKKIDEFANKISEENKRIQADPEGYYDGVRARKEQNTNELNNMLADPSQLALLNKLHDPTYNPTFQEMQLFNRYNDLKQRVNEDETTLLFGPSQLVASNNYKISQRVAQLTTSKENIKKLKNNEVWLPTAENLKNKSRKELRQNLHNIDSILTADNLPRKTRLALEWVKQSQQQHLVHFQNPFEWHEVTGHVKKPDYKVSLAQEVYVPSSRPGGFMGPGGTFGGLGTALGGLSIGL